MPGRQAPAPKRRAFGSIYRRLILDRPGLPEFGVPNPTTKEGQHRGEQRSQADQGHQVTLEGQAEAVQLADLEDYQEIVQGLNRITERKTECRPPRRAARFVTWNTA